MPRNKYPEQTVEKILDAAALLFLQKGYQNTTLQDIIDATKLSKGAVYHHFRSKEEIAQRVGDRLGDQMWEPLRHIRDDPSLTGLQKLQAVFAASFAGQRQQQIAQTLPHLCSNPQFLAMELTNIEAHLAPECIAPMIRQGMADGSIHTADANALAEALFVLADIWLSPQTRPTTPARAAGAERRVSADDPCAWAGSFDGCTGRTAGAAVRTGQRLNFPGGTLRPFLYAYTDQRSVNKKAGGFHEHFFPHRPRADHLPVRQCRPAVCAAAVSAAADRFRCAVRRHHRAGHAACSGRNADRRRAGRPLP